MRKTQVALAALALVASSAALADVTVSGYMDAGLLNVTGKGTALAGGLLGINAINIAGGEDLGNGMKAEFFTQVRFEVPNGQLTTVSGTGAYSPKVFNQSYVGLSTEIGTIQLGRNVDAFAGSALAFDVTGGGNMGSYVDAIILTSASGIFADNQIKYLSPNLGGLNLSASYYAADSTGTAIGNTTKNDYSVGAVYNLGGLTVGGGYANRDATSGRAFHLGAGYDFGIAKVNAVYLDTGNLGTAYGVNAAIPVPSIAALTLTAGWYDVAGAGTNTTDGSSTSIGAKYALSKRTTLFANYQTASSTFATSLGMSQGGLSTAGGTAIVLGVGHAF